MTAVTSVGGASKADSTRAAIAAAAAQALGKAGVQGIRIEDVADEAQVSTGLLYYHFGNRRGVVKAGLIEALHREPEAAAVPASERDPSRSSLWDALEPYLRIDAEHPGARVRADGLRAAVFDDDVRAPLARSTARWEARLVQSVQSAHAEDVVDGNGAVSILAALVDGLRLRVASGVLDAAGARALLQAALLTLLPTEAPRG